MSPENASAICCAIPGLAMTKPITQELMDDTWRTWQPYYRATLNMDDVLEIILNVTKLADLL